MRVAAIDIGTNTVLLLVADGGTGAPLHAVAERATITRLGEGVDRTRRLSPAAVARTRECLEHYARDVRELGAERVAVVGTSAMRDTKGGREVREHVRSLFGVEARVLRGEEEARLTFRGAMSGIAIDARKDLAVFDIGGGSTEVVIGRVEQGAAHVAFAASYDIGSVRLTERQVTHDPPTGKERDALMQTARGVFANVPPLPDSSSPVGIAGTMTTLAAVALCLEHYDGARVHGHLMPLAELRRVVDRLVSVNLETRKRVQGMEPKRADVIVAGGLLALALLEHWAATAVRVSDRGVRWGLAEELISCP
ncbi:MAG TPA: Ppx/GppA family phosphatase [Polyangiaceae bacterium]|nr:Ppx/GppA family phosphatase [Polyangiaceae bacterium]